MIDQRNMRHWWSSKTAKFLISFAISIIFIVVWSFYIWPSFLQSTSVDAEEKSIQLQNAPVTPLKCLPQSFEDMRAATCSTKQLHTSQII